VGGLKIGLPTTSAAIQRVHVSTFSKRTGIGSGLIDGRIARQAVPSAGKT
jgi:hypothetical protein